MSLEEYDYELPSHLIAQEPLPERDHSRLMVVDRARDEVIHAHFYDLPRFLEAGDLLVANDTRVRPARWRLRRKTGGEVEVLLLHPEAEGWLVLLKPYRRVREGEVLVGPRESRVRVRAKRGEGLALLSLEKDEEELWRAGEIPLPPYIRKPLQDPERYQTIYAREEGSAAAPTAGLHFTERTFRDLAEKGVQVAWVTLHVGLGTFRPLREADVARGTLHSEWYRVPEETVAMVKEARARGKRVVAVGTTACRALEAAAKGGELRAREGWTDLFIQPGYTFRVVSSLITNFHLPRSSLLYLVAAFLGREKLLQLYRLAIEREYRFYSFGDAMLIL
ncbi:MAG: tRNA preQ1(34) S-adenosylmethionine ribosyltransferase-isomerase QueA [Clostridiales bacterium]|nr:tRNA preQ1(34) S-adenosylmethionine ribosyltransferase-isomerase QueA [Clostridiales bacterium]